MNNNLTIFFVKPHIIHKSEEIFKYLQKNIIPSKDFNISFRQKFQYAPKSFWKEFYQHMEKTYPKELENMAQKFSSYGDGIDLALINGNDIAKRVKTFAGPTRYNENPENTIRGHFGPYELPNTIVHASEQGEVIRELKILKEYFPVHISL